MGFTVDENYDDKTLLADYYLIIKSNLQKTAEFINEQQAEIGTLDDILENINNTLLPSMSSDIESNRSDAGRLTRAADIIIETEPEGKSERMRFQNIISGVKYCVFAGDTPLTDTYIDMAESTVADTGIFETDDIKVKFYADDGCELAGGALNVTVIAGVKAACLKFYQDLIIYQNKWLDVRENAVTWGEASSFTWDTIKTHKI